MERIHFDDVLPGLYAQALINDTTFSFKEKAKGSLQQGTCPECNRKELFANTQKPWRVQCNNKNSCGYVATTSELYPDIVENLIEAAKNDPENPNALADVFMRYRRGFPIEKMDGWYSQAQFNKQGINTATVRFLLDAERDVYWERLIDQKKGDGQRQNFIGKRRNLKPTDKDYADYDGSLQKGLWWTPPGQTIQANDQVFLVEGIFHAIALHFAGVKVAATLAAGYFPGISIRPYLKKNIVWVWGLDDDKAGVESMAKHCKTLDGMGERYTMALTNTGEQDWDDLFVSKRLLQTKPNFIQSCLYRGQLACAKTKERKAFLHYKERGTRFFIMEFEKALFSVKVDIGKKEIDWDDLKIITDEDLYRHRKVGENFSSNHSILKISACFPQFLYAERNELTRELSYYMRVEFENGAPRVQESMDRNALEGPKGFHKSLVGMAAGGAFYGTDRDYRFMYEDWFRNRTASEEVKTIGHMGYCKTFGGYVFDKYGFKNGQQILVDDIGLIQASDSKTKTTLKDIKFALPDTKAKLDWMADINTAFGINGVVAVAFWFGSIFSEQLREIYGWFPFLEMSGEPGTGKSTLIEFMWKASGRVGRYEGINPTKYTAAGRGRAMTKLAGLPMVMVEGDTINAKQAFDINEMKDAFNGGPIRGIGVATGGSETIEPPFKCGFIVAQNADVDCEKAMISRFIHLLFTEEHFTEKGFDLLGYFRAMETETASAFIYQCMKNETIIINEIKNQFQYLLPIFKASSSIHMVRIQETHALICACFYAITIIFGSDATALRNKVKNHLLARGTNRQRRMSSDHPDIENFWSVYELINVNQVTDTDYHYKNETKEVEVLNHSLDPQYLALNLNEFSARAEKLRHRLPPVKELKRLLVHSKKYKYCQVKTVKSKITEKAKHCWVFEAPKKTKGGLGED